MALMRVPGRALSLADLYGAPEDQKLCAVGLTSSTWAPLEASSTNTLVASTSRVRIDERKRILGVRHSFGSMNLRFVEYVHRRFYRHAQALLPTEKISADLRNWDEGVSRFRVMSVLLLLDCDRRGRVSRTSTVRYGTVPVPYK
jgi:hypothetical protein